MIGLVDEEPSVRPMAESSFRSAISDERALNARRFGSFRFVWASAFLALHLIAGGVMDMPSWRANLLAMAVYWAVALVYWLGRKRAAAASFGVATVPFVEVPFVLLVQWRAIEAGSDPLGVAGFTVAIYMALIVLAALSLRSRLVWTTAAMCALCSIGIQIIARDTAAGFASAMLLIAAVAGICQYSLRRWRNLVTQVSNEQLRRARLGRYFSPSVAERIEHLDERFGGGKDCELTLLFCKRRPKSAAG